MAKIADFAHIFRIPDF